MPIWKSVDLDYSKFVNSGPPTVIDLTFFSHLNATIGNAFKNSYAYYGQECLGVGIPQDFDFTVPEIVIPSSTSKDCSLTPNFNGPPS